MGIHKQGKNIVEIKKKKGLEMTKYYMPQILP